MALIYPFLLLLHNYHTDYYNRKGWYSVLVQAVVDYRYCFLDIYAGWPGSVHDARVLVHSSFYKKADAGQLLSPVNKTINGVNIPVYVIGDSAYPMLPWLMKSFNQPNVDYTCIHNMYTLYYHLSQLAIIIISVHNIMVLVFHHHHMDGSMVVHDIV